MIVCIFFVIHWYVSFFLQSFFHHRYAAHRHFLMSRTWERFFYILCFMVHGSSYISPYAYGIMHRLHHIHTDEEGDPHSPIKTPGFWATMWQTRNSYYNIFIGKTVVDDRLKKDLPEWRSFEKIAHNPLSRSFWIIIYTLFYIAFATAWWQFLLLPITMILATFQGTVINWWAHKYGYVNYPMHNDSKNILPFDLIFLGDAYHNNHHKYPGRTKNSQRWFEIDPTYYTICFLQKIKVVKWKTKNILL